MEAAEPSWLQLFPWGGEKKEEKERGGVGGIKGKLVVDGPEGAALPTCEHRRAALDRSGVVLQHRAVLGGVQSSLVGGNGGTWQR